MSAIKEILQNEWQGAINIFKCLDVDLTECKDLNHFILTVDCVELFEDGFYLEPIDMYFPNENEAFNEMDEQNEQIDNEDLKINLSNLLEIPFYLQTYHNQEIKQTEISSSDLKYLHHFKAWVSSLNEKQNLFFEPQKNKPKNNKRKKAVKV